MKFVKLLIKGEAQWRLCLENKADVDFYFDKEPEKMFMDYLNMSNEKHPLNSRQEGLARIIDARIGAANKGEKIYPILEVAKVADAKWAGMLRYIEKDTICVNEGGGWCGLSGYISTWNAEIVEERVATNIGFPTDITTAKTLVLENNSIIGNQVLEYLRKNRITDCARITMLKERDTAMVIESIKNAETIILESEFVDTEQVESFLGLFLKLEPKNFIVFGNIENLKNYKLFQANDMKHNIKFPQI